MPIIQSQKNYYNNMERKTITSKEIRKQLHLTKQVFRNYLNMGIIKPVAGTEERDNPLFYTDEVAVIREALTSCQSNIKRLETIREKVMDEIFKTNSALSVLQLDDATKEGAVHSIIDSISLFLEKAVPNIKKCHVPLYWLSWKGYDNFNLDKYLKFMVDNKFFHTPQDYCNELYHEVEAIDAKSLNHIIEERDALIQERDALKKELAELKKFLSTGNSTSDENKCLARLGYFKNLTDKQVEGLHLSIFDCGFSVRVINTLKGEEYNGLEIRTLKDVAKFRSSEVLRMRNCGKSSYKEIEEKLAEYDLHLGMDIINIDGKYYCK